MKIESDQKKASGKIGRTKRKKKIFIDVWMGPVNTALTHLYITVLNYLSGDVLGFQNLSHCLHFVNHQETY
jgi:hypothetical protein